MILHLLRDLALALGQRGHHIFYGSADGDDANDPVVDTARAILDGHILPSREQTQMGIYPAVDVSASVPVIMILLAYPTTGSNNISVG